MNKSLPKKLDHMSWTLSAKLLEKCKGDNYLMIIPFEHMAETLKEIWSQFFTFLYTLV